MRTEVYEVDLWELVWRCEDPAELAKLKREAKANHSRLTELCQGDPENMMAVRRYGAQMFAWGLVRGTNWGYQFRKPRPDDTAIRTILKSKTVVKLLLAVPKVSARDICNTLDEKRIPLPWPELREKGELWATCATQARVKMALSHARTCAKQLVVDDRWRSLIHGSGDGDLFDKFRGRKRPPKSTNP
jgi:hypothetical protein